MNESSTRSHILEATSVAADFCASVENARQYEVNEFIIKMLSVLPRLYLIFSDPELNNLISADYDYFPQYVDEDFYESVRRNVEILLGPDDTFLETFEEDMKYSDTPIAANISECLADIFQPLYNFIAIVKESGGEQSEGAYCECRDNFEAYWAQTLCNVLRPLNHLRFNQ